MSRTKLGADGQGRPPSRLEAGTIAAWCGLAILAAIVLCAIFAPLIAPYPPNEGSLANTLRPPAWAAGGSSVHILGTDELGRDIASRIIYGARISISIAATAILLSGAFGIGIGLVAGYLEGRVDAVVMRAVDAMLALPAVLIALALVSTRRGGVANVVIIIALTLWAYYARQARGEALSIKQRDYVVLARVAGCSPWRIMLRHILPNAADTLIVLATLQVGWVILFESALSFLGAGVPPPTAAWGSMVAQGRQLITSAWWVSLFPGVAILVTVLSVNVFGDWLRDVLDPTQVQL